MTGNHEPGDLQRAFYNAAYPVLHRRSANELPAFIRRFELHRTDAALQLLNGGHHLLDVGFGDGKLLCKAAPRFKRLTGLDVSDTQLATAQQNLMSCGVANVELMLGNIDRGLPFPSNHFDAVTAVALLAFVFDPLHALDEIHRVLQPGGRLVVEALNLVYLPRRLAVMAGQLPPHTSCHGWEGGHLHNFTRPALLRLVRDHGFTVERCTGSGVFASLRTWWPDLLLGNIIVLARK